MKTFNNKHTRNKSIATAPSLPSTIVQGVLAIFSFIWMLAVIKVFLLEGHHTISHEPESLEVITKGSGHGTLFARTALEINPTLYRSHDTIEFRSHHDAQKNELTEKAAKLVVPTSSEWAFIRASPDYKIAGNREHVIDKDPRSLVEVVNTPKVEVSPVILKKASDLSWPPVQLDGSIAVTDGVEVMPVIGLKVPRFYMPAPEFDLNKVGSKVNGEDTIFLMIASYRDFQCRETITSAYSKSDHPERLFIGAVDQTVPGDTGCTDLVISCTDDPSQPICKYRDQISVFHMDAEYATGPVTGNAEML
jgi:Glycosyltransferase (GlcNAc)